MSPFIETICIENGVIHHLALHNERMNRTRREVLGQTNALNLSDFIQPDNYSERTKCRVEYAEGIRKVEYAPYHIRPVYSLKLVSVDKIEYPYKSADRCLLNDLFACKEACDDILIIRHGLLTDTSICNLALWNGQDWVTPADPLLPGTMRAALLDKGLIISGSIRSEDLPAYSRIRLFNAMIRFGEIELDVLKVYGYEL